MYEIFQNKLKLRNVTLSATGDEEFVSTPMTGKN
jgi:hypothetical protein